MAACLIEINFSLRYQRTKQLQTDKLCQKFSESNLTAAVGATEEDLMTWQNFAPNCQQGKELRIDTVAFKAQLSITGTNLWDFMMRLVLMGFYPYFSTPRPPPPHPPPPAPCPSPALPSSSASQCHVFVVVRSLNSEVDATRYVNRRLRAQSVFLRHFRQVGIGYSFFSGWYIPLSQLSKQGKGKARERALSHRLQLWSNAGERGYFFAAEWGGHWIPERVPIHS